MRLNGTKQETGNSNTRTIYFVLVLKRNADDNKMKFEICVRSMNCSYSYI